MSTTVNIKSVHVLYTPGSCIFSLIGSENRYPVVYQVEFNTASVANRYNAVFAQDPITGLAIPALGSYLAENTTLQLLKITPDWQQVGSSCDGRRVLVTCDYGVQVRGNITDPSTPPWNRPVYADMDIVLRPYERVVDAAGHPHVTTAGVPFSTPLKILYGDKRLILKHAQRCSDFSKAVVQALTGTVNNRDLQYTNSVTGEVYPIPKYHGRITRVSAPQDVWVDPQTQVKTPFYNITIEIEIMATGMNKVPAVGTIVDKTGKGIKNGESIGFRATCELNAGVTCLSSAGDALAPCWVYDVSADGTKRKDEDGKELIVPAPHPMPLKSDGKQVSNSAVVAEADLVWLVFDAAVESSWSTFNI